MLPGIMKRELQKNCMRYDGKRDSSKCILFTQNNKKNSCVWIRNETP